MHAAISGAYRKQNITTLEIRFNPMKRNRGGERDLDHILLAAARGLDRAALEYPQVRAGLIVMIDRTFTLEQNSNRHRQGDRVRQLECSSAWTSPGPRPEGAPLRLRGAGAAGGTGAPRPGWA